MKRKQHKYKLDDVLWWQSDENTQIHVRVVVLIAPTAASPEPLYMVTTDWRKEKSPNKMSVSHLVRESALKERLVTVQ